MQKKMELLPILIGKFKWERKVINPPGEAKEDLEIINDLGKALGLDWNYNHASEVFNEMSKLCPHLTILAGKELTKRTL